MLPVPAPTVWEPTEIFMKKSYFKFDAAHFIAHKVRRAPLPDAVPCFSVPIWHNSPSLNALESCFPIWIEDAAHLDS